MTIWTDLQVLGQHGWMPVDLRVVRVPAEQRDPEQGDTAAADERQPART